MMVTAAASPADDDMVSAMFTRVRRRRERFASAEEVGKTIRTERLRDVRRCSDGLEGYTAELAEFGGSNERPKACCVAQRDARQVNA